MIAGLLSAQNLESTTATAFVSGHREVTGPESAHVRVRAWCIFWVSGDVFVCFPKLLFYNVWTLSAYKTKHVPEEIGILMIAS